MINIINSNQCMSEFNNSYINYIPDLINYINNDRNKL